MPTPEESWRLTVAARARRQAAHPCPETPRVKIRVHVPDPDMATCPWCDGVGRSGRFICEVCQPDALTVVNFVPVNEDEDLTGWP